MNNQDYEDFKKYLQKGILPGSFPSTKSNFMRAVRKLKVNKKGVLTRGGKLVVKKSERKQVYDQMHEHSGTQLLARKLS